MIWKTTLSDGMILNAEVSGTVPDVLLVHGIPGSAAIWRAVTERLSDRRQVIAPDLIGFGESSRTSDIAQLWADRQAEALAHLLDDLGVGRIVVAGHDFGGPVAIHLAHRVPGRIAGLVLAATNVFGDTPIPFPLSGVTWPVVGPAWARVLFSSPSLRMMVTRGVGTPPPSINFDRYVGDRAQVAAIRVIFATALRELRLRYEPITQMLRSLRVPVRVVWGDRDPFFGIEQGERTAGLVEGATLATLRDAGHFLPEERPDDLARIIAEI